MKLLHGDCLYLMKDIPDKSVDLVVTDPPYGINYQSQRRKDKSEWKPKILNDEKPFIEFIPELKRIISPSGSIFIFTRWDKQQQFIDEMEREKLKVDNIIIWDKVVHGMGDLKKSYGSRYESIIFHSEKDFRFNGKRPTDIIRAQRVNPNKLIHPNEKPVELLETIILQTTKENEVVLDCFMGSGSTGVACKNTGRDFIGIELDERYFNIACDRINNTTMRKKKLF